MGAGAGAGAGVCGGVGVGAGAVEVRAAVPGTPAAIAQAVRTIAQAARMRVARAWTRVNMSSPFDWLMPGRGTKRGQDAGARSVRRASTSGAPAAS